MGEVIGAFDAKAIDQGEFNSWVDLLKDNAHKHVKASKKKPNPEKDYKHIEDVGKALKSLIQLLTDKDFAKKTAEERQKALEEILVILFGSLLGDKYGGDELPGEIKDLIEVVIHHPDDKEKKKKLYEEIKKLIVKASVSSAPGLAAAFQKVLVASHKQKHPQSDDKVLEAAGKNLNVLGDKIIVLIRLACHDVDEKERQELLEKSALELLTSAVIVEQLEWFVTENFLTYTQAFQLGMKLGKPFGEQIAKDLGQVIKVRQAEDIMIALSQKDGNWVEHAATGTTTRVTLESGGFMGWQATAYWDANAQDIRIQVITHENRPFLMDSNGNQVAETIAPPPALTDPPKVDDSGNRPAMAYKIAQSKSKALEDEREAARAASDRVADHLRVQERIEGIKGRITDLQTVLTNQPGHAANPQRQKELEELKKRRMELIHELAVAEADHLVAFHVYWMKRKRYSDAIRTWLIKAATAENWTKEEFEYTRAKYGSAGIGPADLPPKETARAPEPSPATTGRRFGPRAAGGAAAALVMVVGAGMVLTGGGDEPKRTAAEAPAQKASAAPEMQEEAAVPKEKAPRSTLNVSPMRINFVEEEFSTHYAVVALDEAADDVEFSWELTPPATDPGCDNQGESTSTDVEFVWAHGDQHGCDHTKQGALGHEGTVSVTIRGATETCTGSYTGSQGAGDSPSARVKLTCK